MLALSLGAVNQKSNLWLAVLLMAVFAVTRWPGLLPNNFSAAYALVFCAGVFLPRTLAWWLPLATMLVTDILLNLFYYGVSAWKPAMFASYAVYAFLIWFGSRFKPQAHFLKLICGGVLGAVLFYLLTNTAAWFFNPFGNPEYTRDLAGFITALTKGAGGYPETWRFFLNTLLSGGLFTGLFVGAMKLTAAESPLEKEGPQAAAEETEPSAEPEPGDARS
jgi:hypothetical protein